MPFLFLCAILAFCFQFFALRVSPRRWVHLLTFALLEFPPLLAVLYYAIARPQDSFWAASAHGCWESCGKSPNGGTYV